CSGFAQTVLKLMGIRLKRDAYLQAEQGETVGELSEAREGDLAFFNNDKGRVIHVGIILSQQRIVHASGKVRIDRLDEKGIVNSETGKRTHDLCTMKRYF
ncbi:MAG: C40 family peptidase, partial [Flavisolibacter sp.]